MNQQLEELLKAWDACQQATGEEAKRLRAAYESHLDDACERTEVSRETLQRMVRRVYQRWQWADDPKFPKNLRNMRLD